jgi:hypothetical protein
MKVIGLDPGPKETAIVIWDGTMLLGAGKYENPKILACLDVQDAVVACEHLQCFGMGVGKEVFETAYWIGDFRAECRNLNLRFVPVFRSEVKIHHCQSAKANDSNIRYALEDRFGKKGTKKRPGLMYPLVGSDMRSAFAIAVMVYDRL